jgi:hypothetical protein
MSEICLLLDEHVPLVIQMQLTRMMEGLRVYAIGDHFAPQRGASDPEILLWLETHDCLLVTNNRSTMPVHLRQHLAAGHHVPGIIQLPKRLRATGKILADLVLLCSASKPGEFMDQIVYLPLR